MFTRVITGRFPRLIILRRQDNQKESRSLRASYFRINPFARFLLERRNRNALGLRFASFAKLYIANCTANETLAGIAIATRRTMTSSRRSTE